MQWIPSSAWWITICETFVNPTWSSTHCASWFITPWTIPQSKIVAFLYVWCHQHLAKLKTLLKIHRWPDICRFQTLVFLIPEPTQETLIFCVFCLQITNVSNMVLWVGILGWMSWLFFLAPSSLTVRLSVGWWINLVGWLDDSWANWHSFQYRVQLFDIDTWHRHLQSSIRI